jgi:hypothetical protein
VTQTSLSITAAASTSGLAMPSLNPSRLRGVPAGRGGLAKPSMRHREAHGFWNTSETERAVLIWCYGGAASLEEAGYVYEPD